jgi:hypothetical protein
MTYAEIVGGPNDGVRRLIGDAVSPYRFSSLEIYGYVNSGLQNLFKLRPTAFFVNGRMPTTEAAMLPPTPAVVDAASGAADVPADDRYGEALAYYAGAKCLERDDADTMNAALSAAYMQKFAELARM